MITKLMVNAKHNQLRLRLYTSLLAVHGAGFPTICILFTFLFCDWGRRKKPSFLFSGNTRRCEETKRKNGKRQIK
jgi:hypothetical protein